jgi:hypothetical protein
LATAIFNPDDGPVKGRCSMRKILLLIQSLRARIMQWLGDPDPNRRLTGIGKRIRRRRLALRAITSPAISFSEMATIEPLVVAAEATNNG